MHICTKLVAVGIFLLLPNFLIAQEKLPLTVSVFSNATNLPTRPYYIFAPIHPGITVGTAFRYNTNAKHRLGQTFKIGFFHHRYVQSVVQLYSEFTYKYTLKNGLDFGPNVGIGYAHAFPATQIFELNSNGEYERKTNFGRPQFMGGIAAEVGYTFKNFARSSPRIYTNYQFWLQTPFINQYVPLLPNTALHVGVSMLVLKKPHFMKRRTITPPDF